MIRSASKGAKSLSEHLGRQQTSSLRLNCRVNTSAVGSRISFSTRQNDGVLTPFSEQTSCREQPQPHPAVAYAYDFDDDHADDLKELHDHKISREQTAFSGIRSVKHDVTDRRIGTPLTSAAGGASGRGPSSSTPYPPPSSMVSSKEAHLRKVGGGGGGGRHRCPKCGTTVTFRCDYEENTFYCASCSGWFVANPNVIMSNEDGKPDGSPYEEFMAKNSAERTSDPEVLMRHVSCQ